MDMILMVFIMKKEKGRSPKIILSFDMLTKYYLKFLVK